MHIVIPPHQEMVPESMVAGIFETIGVSPCHFECHADTVTAWARIFELMVNRYALFNRYVTNFKLPPCKKKPKSLIAYNRIDHRNVHYIPHSETALDNLGSGGLHRLYMATRSSR